MTIRNARCSGRRRYFVGGRNREVQQHVQAIFDDLGEPVGRLPESALRFVLSNPGTRPPRPGADRCGRAAAG